VRRGLVARPPRPLNRGVSCSIGAFMTFRESFFNVRRQWAGCVLVVAVLAPSPRVACGHSILDDALEVTKVLQPLDHQIREQLVTWFAERDAAEARYGRESAEWFEANDRHNPLAVHGARILGYARENPGTPDAQTCLSYIVDWGEGDPAALYRSACAELIAHEKDNAALSWLCSRCTNSLQLDTMEEFLAKLLQSSANPTVQGAAAFNLAQLYDNAVEMRLVLDERRKRFREAGLVKALPKLDLLEKRSHDELVGRRAEFLKLVIEKYSGEKPWSADRTFGRLNYRFREDSEQPSYGELATKLSHEIKNLRVGCVPPDFTGMTIDGRRFRIAENRGKPILLMFSFKGCGACEAMYPALRKVQERYSPNGFSVLGVMVDETIDTVREAVAAGNITWPCVWDGPAGPIAKLYQVQSYPTVLLVGGDGRIKSIRLRREDELVANIEKYLKEQSAK